MADQKEIKIGGQAVMEGVMMRSPHYYAVAVRNPQGEIVIKSDEVRSITKKFPWFKKFIFRGIVVLVESLVLGVKALNYSADIQILELQQEGHRRMPATDFLRGYPVANGDLFE